MSNVTRDSEGRLQVEFACERLCGMSADEVRALPAPEQTAVLNTLTNRVGLICLLGEQEAERRWREREDALMSAIKEQTATSAGAGSRWVTIKPPCDCRFWMIRGNRVGFIGDVCAIDQWPGMLVNEEPGDDAAYVGIAIDPSLAKATLMGWQVGAGVCEFGAAADDLLDACERGEFVRLEGSTRVIDEFARWDVPVKLGGDLHVCSVGVIEAVSGQFLTLVSSDPDMTTAAEPKRPTIVFREVAEPSPEACLTAEVVAELTPEAAEVLALILRGGLPAGASELGDDELSLLKTGSLPGLQEGAVAAACPPQRLPTYGYVIGVIETPDSDMILLVRGEGDDSGVTIAFARDSFLAHLSPAATEALAELLDEFARAHRPTETASPGNTRAWGSERQKSSSVVTAANERQRPSKNSDAPSERGLSLRTDEGDRTDRAEDAAANVSQLPEDVDVSEAA
jgi:hypothetical protein